jgi:hypothetical protein
MVRIYVLSEVNTDGSHFQGPKGLQWIPTQSEYFVASSNSDHEDMINRIGLSVPHNGKD